MENTLKGIPLLGQVLTNQFEGGRSNSRHQFNVPAILIWMRRDVCVQCQIFYRVSKINFRRQSLAKIIFFFFHFLRHWGKTFRT